MSKLTATDRKDYRKLIETKQTDLLKALNGDLFRNKEDLIQEALYTQGFQYNSEELQSKMEAIQQEINDVVSEHLPNEEAILEIKVAEASEKIDEEMMLLKTEYSGRLEALQAQKKEIRSNLMGDHVSLVTKVAREKIPGKVEDRTKLQTELEKVKFIETSVSVEINRKTALVKKMRYRIQSAINDKINELFEKLINAETRDEAKSLITEVPTIAELIVSCETAEGLARIVQKLSPSLALPPPKQPEIKPEDLKVVTEIKQVMESPTPTTTEQTDDEENEEEEEEVEEEEEEEEEEEAVNA